MFGLLAFLLAFSAGVAVGPVKVWTGTITLPTWLEGPPDSNPLFDTFNAVWDEPSYPYSRRATFTDQKVDHAWRAVYLENEYLKCSFLPDLGGHLYTCRDKVSGKDMFYANPSIKKGPVGLRGAWVALGIELNFPVGHTWVNTSPVDFATRQNPDRSASVFLSSVDRVTGMQWRVEFVLRPASAVLEQRVTLYNRSSVRRRYYWWADASMRLEDKATTFVLPANLTGTHGLTEIDTWPINSSGADLSIVGNDQKDGVGLFAYGCREPFFGVYHALSRTGTVHYADVNAVPGKKVWSPGAEGDKWVRKNLSDDGSTFVEIQSGLFQNQETFQFLAPQESKTFTEYWMPARDLGGISRANLHGVLSLRRSKETGGRVALAAELNVNHPVAGAKIRILDGDRLVTEEMLDLAPSATFARTIPDLPASSKYRFELADSSGSVLLAHSEGPWDALTAHEVKLGKQPQIDDSNRKSTEDFVRAAEYRETLNRLDSAHSDYASALQSSSDGQILLKAGRLSVTMNRFAEAVELLSKARLVKDDPEGRYYLGLAFANLGDDGKARTEWTAISSDPQFGQVANLELACLLSRARDYAAALRAVRTAIGDSTGVVRAGAIEVALLRRLERMDEAKARLAFWRSIDPTDLLLRYEQFRLNPEDDTGFLRQLAADPERVLNIVTHLFDLGLYDDSLLLTDRTYDPVDPIDTEPGTPSPQDYPLVVYYRAWARERLGQEKARDDYHAASGLSTLYVFPSRPGSVPVLEAAIRRNPTDAAAHSLLGSLYFSFRMVDEAVAEWQKARALRSLEFNRAEDVRRDLPALHRNLGRALLEIKKDYPAAVEVLQEAIQVDPGNPEVKEALEKALTLRGPLRPATSKKKRK